MALFQSLLMCVSMVWIISIVGAMVVSDAFKQENLAAQFIVYGGVFTGLSMLILFFA